MKVAVPLDSPALCRECRGGGCGYCTRGLVCPTCRGRRVNDAGQVCRACCEGNQINPRKELAVIRAYLRELYRGRRVATSVKNSKRRTA